VTRCGDVIPATRDTRAAAFAAAFSDSDDGTTKKPDGLTFALSCNDFGRLEGERIGDAASGVVWSARAARPPRRVLPCSEPAEEPACSERVRVRIRYAHRWR